MSYIPPRAGENIKHFKISIGVAKESAECQNVKSLLTEVWQYIQVSGVLPSTYKSGQYRLYCDQDKAASN